MKCRAHRCCLVETLSVYAAFWPPQAFRTRRRRPSVEGATFESSHRRYAFSLNNGTIIPFVTGVTLELC